MKPIYFPFTYISKPAEKLLFSCFQTVVVYQPTSLAVPYDMKALEKNGLLDIRIPIKTGDDAINKLVKNYKNWMSSHSGTDLKFLKTGMTTPPFFDEFSVSHIRSEIKKRQPEKPDPDLLARLFLEFTQEFDQKNAEVDRDIRSSEIKKRNLFKLIRGEAVENNAPPFLDQMEDQGSHMLIERVSAWSRLMLHDTEVSNLFITTSRLVFDYLMEKSPNAIQLFYIDTIPIDSVEEKAFFSWKDRLMRYLDAVVNNTAPVASIDRSIDQHVAADSSKVASFRLYVVEGESPIEFFIRSGEIVLPNRAEIESKNSLKKTLIGLIESINI